ncbi:MAG: SpoIIE family protein phosphatase [Deltaproteobacteria bacterium]|nr:SpoIIE family protein phosphatase [Deltaproteobacteria bacterium]
MTLEEVLAQNDAELLAKLPSAELARLFWRYKGLQKSVERDNSFWSSTNDNLKQAYEKLDEQERELARTYAIIQDDLSVAQNVQRALLPRMLGEMSEELELAVYHKQLTEVGGDYYDFFRLPNNRYAIGVFDISGHGVSAALITAFLKAQFMQVMEHFDSPQGIVEWVNRTSFDFLREVRKYATVNLVSFEPDGFRYVSGGGYGMLLHNNETHLFEKKNHFLGLRLKPYREFSLPFSQGDLLVLYTDGMVEAQNAAGVDYSVRRLNNLIIEHRDAPVQEIVDRCVADYESFRHKDFDDITLLVMRKKGNP